MTSISLTNGEEEYDYRRDSYQPDIIPAQGYLPVAERIEGEFIRDSLDRRIALVAQGQRQATYEIDQCIRATVPSDAFRARAAQHWEERKNSHESRAWTSVALAAIGIGAAVIWAPWLSVASVVAGVYAAVQFRKMGEASKQVAGWQENPAEKLAMGRKRAYEEGFVYLYRNDLKLGERSNHAILLPCEVQHLFNRYFDQTCVTLSAQRCITDGQKKEWLDRFRTDNPISDRVLRYVYGTVPAEYSSISQNFETIRFSLQNVEAEFSRLRQLRKADSAEVVSQIESQRALAAAIPNGALSYKLSEAKDERDRQLRLYGEGYRHDIESEYKAKKAQYQAVYAAAMLPITLYFDSKVKEARDALKVVLGVISQQEASAFSPYYEYAQGIVTATAATKNGGYIYSQQPFNAGQILQIPNLPKIEINFIYQAPAEVDPDFFRR